MSGLPLAAGSKMGNLLINPSDVGGTETPMRCPAWWILDLSPLWGFPDQRGQNIVLPGTPGRHAYPKRDDETRYVMAMWIVGTVDRAGAPNVDPFTGLRANLDDLRANVGPATVGNTRSATLVLPDASTLSADVQCLLTLGAQTITDCRAVLQLTIPAGGFA